MEKKKRLSILMVCLMFLTCFFSFGTVKTNKVSAAMPEYIGQNCIYYFFDLYPSIDEATLTATYGSTYSILLDRQTVDEQGFADLIDDGYFSVLSDCIVVIDIKTFDPSAFNGLWQNLKQNDCTVILVTAEFYEASVSTSAVDEHYESDLDRFFAFVRNARIDIENNISQNENVQLLIDGNFITQENISYIDGSFVDCPFATILLDRFIGSSVSILVHTGGTNYVDLIEGGSAAIDAEKATFALGCSALDSDFYNHLSSLQNSSAIREIYLMEGSPIVISHPGLRVTTEWELAARYGYEGDEATELINLINPYAF